MTDSAVLDDGLFRALVDASPAAIGITVGEALVYANPAGLRLLGAADASEVLGSWVTRFVHPDEYAASAERVRRLRAGERLPPSVQRWIRLDGREMFVEVSSFPTMYRGEVSFQVVAREVTDQVRAERLREGEALLLEMIGQGVALEVILAELAHLVEEQIPGALASIHLIDSTGRRLRLGAAPDLPESYRLADVSVECEADSPLIQRAAHLARIALERTHTVRALRESEHRFRTLVEQSPDAILIHAEGVLRFANAAALRLFRATGAHLIGRPISDFIHPGSRAGARRKGHGRGGVEIELLRADGSAFPAEVAAAPCEYNGQRAIQAVVRDLSERKEVEEELRRQAVLFATISDGVIITGTDGKIRDWNPGAERIFGFSRREAVGRTPALLHPREGESVGAGIVAGVERDGSWQGEMTTVRKDGAEVVCEVTVLPLRDEEGRMIATIGINRDVTDRRRLEEQLMQSQKMEAVGRLAGGVAHDFNNMLTAIKGFAALLELDLQENLESGVYLGEIRKAVDQAASLTRQLLAYGRRQTMQPKVLRLNEVVESAERMLRRLIPAHIGIETELDPGLGCTRVDPHQIERVLVNLAVNARDAMPDGGTLEIVTRNREITERQRRAFPGVPAGAYVQLSVRDTGVGMDAETQKHIFEPFFTTKGPGQGTGLGLSTVIGIVQQSGGYVRVESAPGEGSTFVVLLPLVGAGAAEEDSARILPAPPNGRGTILVAEDEDPVRMLVRVTLQRQGYQVLEARDGEDALRILCESGARVDLLLTDVVMPRMGGHALTRRLREKDPGLRVVFMSGYAASALEADGILELGHRFLQKPFEPHALVDAVRDELGVGQPPRAVAS